MRSRAWVESSRIMLCTRGVRDMVSLLAPSQLISVIERDKAMGAIGIPVGIELRGGLELFVFQAGRMSDLKAN